MEQGNRTKYLVVHSRIIGISTKSLRFLNEEQPYN